MAKRKGKRDFEFFRRHEMLIWALIVLVPVSILTVGYLVAPKLIWDEFLFRYYWAPVEADAVGHPVNGITDAYNMVDTPTYGVILVLALFGIYRYLGRLDIRPGAEMFLATIPYIILGSMLRVLQDSTLFTGRATYLFIAPIIYIFIGLVTLLKLGEAHRIHELEKAGRRKLALMFFGGILAFFNMLYLIGYYFYANDRELFSTDHRNLAWMMNPIVVVLLSIAAFLALLVMIKRRGRLYIHDVYAIFGWHFVAIALFYIVKYVMLGGIWPDYVEPYEGWVRQGMPLEQLFLVPMLAVAATSIFAGACYLLTSKYKWLEIYWKRPVNLAIMYAHMLDAAATFTALQWFSYGEKHVVPNFLISLSGSPAVMFPLKGVVIAIVIYALDVELKKDLEKNRLMQVLIRIAIAVLGLAPGIRDFLRLGLGT